VRRDRADAAFDAVGVELDAPVFEEAFQPIPVVQSITDCLGGWAARGQSFYLRIEPDAQVRDQRFALRLA